MPGFVVSQVELKFPTITFGPLELELNGIGPKLWVVLLLMVVNVIETAIVILPKIAVIIPIRVFDTPPTFGAARAL